MCLTAWPCERLLACAMSARAECAQVGSLVNRQVDQPIVLLRPSKLSQALFSPAAAMDDGILSLCCQCI